MAARAGQGSLGKLIANDELYQKANGTIDKVNKLIDQHNRNFPAESRLPMDPRSRDFVPVGGRPYRRDLLDAAWVLGHFPAA